MTHYDECGNEVKVGDHVAVTALHAGWGAYQNMTGGRCLVVAVSGRTRVTIQVPSLVGTSTVRPQVLRVMAAGDSRTLRTWADVDWRASC